jgi:hypothetical protein
MYIYMLICMGTCKYYLHMTKDKQLTFLIEEEKRDKLRQHCADLGLTISQVLTNYVDDILSGSTQIQTSTYTSTCNVNIEELVEAAIDKREPKLLDIIFSPTNQINTKLQEYGEDIEKLENALYTCQSMIRNLTDLVNKQNIEPTHTTNPQPPIKTQPSGETSTDDKIYTLEDTKRLITSIYKANLENNNPSDRTSQEGISNILTRQNYPHPNGKKWNRDEVRKICKLWDIATK